MGRPFNGRFLSHWTLFLLVVKCLNTNDKCSIWYNKEIEATTLTKLWQKYKWFQMKVVPFIINQILTILFLTLLFLIWKKKHFG